MKNIVVNLYTFKSGATNFQINKWIENKGIKIDSFTPEKSEICLHDKDLADNFTKIYEELYKSFNIITFNSAIMNAFRIAYKKKLNTDVKEINFYIIDKDFNEEKITVNEDGSLSNWPEDFFDIWEKQLSQIIA